MWLRIIFGLSSVYLLAVGIATVAEEARVPAVEQIYNPDLGVVDRCTTCHRDPPHPAGLMDRHPVEVVGCTICHDGQGRATVLPDAHGAVAHWDRPLRRGFLVESACAFCHREAPVPRAPRLSNGQRLLRERGCLGCHHVEGEAEPERVGPDLTGVGSKTSERWLFAWLKDPRQLLPATRMPTFAVADEDAAALASYLAAEKDPEVEARPEPGAGDATRGGNLFRGTRCVSCHAVHGKGGTLAPDLGSAAEKLSPRWLAAWLEDPHRYQPATKMPHFRFSASEVLDLVAYIREEMSDPDLAEKLAGQKLPALEPGAARRHGAKLYRELGCSGCHARRGEPRGERVGPDLSEIGSADLHALDFGRSTVRRTRADFIFEKLVDPRVFGPALRMPRFSLTESEVRDLTIALLSRTERHAPSKRWEVPARPAPRYEPEGEFGELVKRYRCLSCHRVRGAGGTLAPDLSFEGSRVTGAWLRSYLRVAYSIRPMLEERMPVFRFDDREVETLARHMETDFVTDRFPRDLDARLTPELAAKGRRLFDERGCQGCHILGDKGGYVGPSFTAGAAVGDKLTAGFMYAWLKDPRALVPGTLEPRYGFSDAEALALTAYLKSIRAGAAEGPR